MEDLEKFNIEKKKMRREDRLGEVDYATLNKQDIEQRKLELLTSQLVESKKLWIKLSEDQVSGQTCLDVLTAYQDKDNNCPYCSNNALLSIILLRNRKRVVNLIN